MQDFDKEPLQNNGGLPEIEKHSHPESEAGDNAIEPSEEDKDELLNNWRDAMNDDSFVPEVQQRTGEGPGKSELCEEHNDGEQTT